MLFPCRRRWLPTRRERHPGTVPGGGGIPLPQNDSKNWENWKNDRVHRANELAKPARGRRGRSQLGGSVHPIHHRRRTRLYANSVACLTRCTTSGCDDSSLWWYEFKVEYFLLRTIIAIHDKQQHHTRALFEPILRPRRSSLPFPPVSRPVSRFKQFKQRH